MNDGARRSRRFGGGSARGAAALALLALGSAAAGCGSSRHAAQTASAPAPSAPSRLRGLTAEPLPTKPSFTLTDTSGRPYRFSAATRGKLTYLYFGYTHCPDACPTTMTDIAYALRRQSPAIRRRVAVVFVSVDPRRDTPRALRAWLDHYDRSFIGLTGTMSQVRAAEQAAGVPLAPPEKEKGASYAVAHSSLVLPYSRDGRAHVVYTEGFRPQDYAHDMPLLLRFGG